MVEIAAGWGRNTAHLIPLSGSLIATDINADGIERMRRRFSNETKVKDGSVKFYANNGTALPMVPDG